ncbi:MAG: hypothetical protein RBT45_01270 [Acholeplasmataceae bacterium]|jgi:hypothetical protein|nr:hypothetical protein [Acholeplasmataceae bacterium]
MSTQELVIILALPILLIQCSLAIYVILIIQKEGVRNLNKSLWIAIGTIGGIIGSIVFLLYGRRSDYHD